MLDSPLTSDDAARNAALLRAAAEAVEELQRRLDLRVEAMHFEGPAAEDFRTTMDERSQRATRISQRLNDLASGVSAGQDI